MLWDTHFIFIRKEVFKIKKFLTCSISIIISFITKINLVYFGLILLNLIDYITGITASLYKGTKISSKRSIRGIYKKVGHWLLVLTGIVIDIFTIKYLNITLPYNLSLGGCISVWLSINEIISILENYCKISDNKLPNFLRRFIDENKGEKQ